MKKLALISSSAGESKPFVVELDDEEISIQLTVFTSRYNADRLLN